MKINKIDIDKLGLIEDRKARSKTFFFKTKKKMLNSMKTILIF